MPMLDVFEYNRGLGNGKVLAPNPVWPGRGLGNTNPIDTQGSVFRSITTELKSRRSLVQRESGPELALRKPGAAQLGFSSDPPNVTVNERESGADRRIFSSDQDSLIGELPRAKLPKPAGQVVLFRRVMEDWSFSDDEAATLLGFEAASDINQIYVGSKPVGHRDANDRLRAVLRIATDLDALFQEVGAIRDWLSEPQRGLGGVTPRALLTEGSMENLLRVRHYVAYLSGR